MNQTVGHNHAPTTRPAEIFERLYSRGFVPVIEDFVEYTRALDRVAPVRATLNIEETPRGFPPDKIRQAWVGKTLPIRTRLDGGDIGYAILAREAIESLRDDEPEALEWWENYYETQASEQDYGTGIENAGSLYQGWMANICVLTFGWECGTPALV